MPRDARFEQAEVSGFISTPRSRIALLLILALCAFTALAWIATSMAGAVTDSEEFAKFGSEGSGSGQFSYTYNMASDPVTGHLYVTDPGDNRIDVFTAWGEFVEALGWGVADGNSAFETCTTICLGGIAGAGKGQFKAPFGVAVDSSGDVYVLDLDNERVQKFDSSGHFILMFGGEVNKTTGGDVCTAASGDECQAGTTGSGSGEFSEGDSLAISQTGTVLVGGVGRIEEFEPDGSFKGEFKVSGIVDGIAPDPTTSDIYVLLRRQDDIHKLSSSGTELGSLKVHEPRAIAIDADRNLYVVKQESSNPPFEPQKVIEFSSSGAEVSHCCTPPLLPGQPEGGQRYFQTALATNTAGDLYVASGVSGGYITALGPPPVKWPPPHVPPEVVSQFLASAESTSATVKAQVNPNFIADTRYYIEYGLADCASSACVQQPAAPGPELGAGAVKKAITTPGVTLAGLQPGRTYHYRFVAQSSGGGPVYGPDVTFTTFASVSPSQVCPANEAFRTGLSADLPDCRAYEMVSPLDKSNGDVFTLPDITSFQNMLDQSSTDGEALTYSSIRAFGGAEGGPWTSQYLARRGADGWKSEALGGSLVGHFRDSFENEFEAFSPDLCDSWVVPGGEPTLAPGAVAGFPNLYRRENCPKGYEALTTVKPPSLTPEKYYPELQGHSADGTKAIFRVSDNLTPDSPAQPAGCSAAGQFICQTRLYEASGGAFGYVCAFPEGTAVKVEAEFPDCSAGSPGEENTFGRGSSVSHAISEDGSRVYWSASAEPTSVGKVYVRINATTTLPVSETQTTKPARFWGASTDGSKALFEVEDPSTTKNQNLYLYELGEEPGSSTLPIAGKVLGVAAQSEDLSRVYFVSEEVLAGTNGASADEPNLYLHQESENVFIATLSSPDVRSKEFLSDTSIMPIYHAARATPDGGRLAFISTGPLTGFDSTDLQSGQADSEVFTYDAATRKLDCPSCSPAGARPAGRDISPPGAASGLLWTAASLPAPPTQFYAPRALSNDGNHLFFTAYTDLLPADTNGKADVYEWEAVGSGSCKDESDPDYYPINGGCLFLISSGESPSDSELLDTGGNGRDAFFTTNASLLPQDPGLIDVYDARINGGFPPPPVPAAACEGEACSGMPAPPLDTTPASFAFSGPDNLIPPVLSASKAKAKPRVKPCRKGTVRKKGKCVKKKPSTRKGSAKHGKAGKSSRGMVKRNRRAPR